jgi:GT2 family glycosyltransferase
MSKNVGLRQGNPRVGAVVLNWHGRAETLHCVETLLASSYEPLDIVVVDNGSFDGTIKEIERRWPAVTTSQLPENVGYAGGNNRGIIEALARGADHVLVLNNDVQISACMIEALMAQMRGDVAACGPSVYCRDERRQIQSVGGTFDTLRGMAHPIRAKGSSASDVDWLSGSVLLLARNALDTVGGFDTKFFSYMEDVDWCLRAHEAGLRVIAVPNAEAWHGAGAGAEWSFMQFLITRNRIWLVLRHSPGIKRYAALAYLCLLKTPVDIAACVKSSDWAGAAATAKGLLWHAGLFRRSNPLSQIQAFSGFPPQSNTSPR